MNPSLSRLQKTLSQKIYVCLCVYTYKYIIVYMYTYCIYICIKIDGIMTDKNKNFENGRDKLHPLVVDEGPQLSENGLYEL